MSKYFICQLIACVIAILAFIYGVVHLLKKKTPLYQRIIMWSVGCFLLYAIVSVVNSLLFPVKEIEINISYISIFGCFLALFSANYGGMDQVVSDVPSGNKFPSIIALVIDVLFISMLVAIYFVWKDIQFTTGICIIVAYFPILPAVYYNVKHLLLPVDELEILKRNRGINVLSILLYISFIFYAFVLAKSNALLSGICSIVSSCIIMGIVVLAKKGVYRW